MGLFCCAFMDFFLIYIYRPIYRHIGFLNHKIFVSVSALKILDRSGYSPDYQGDFTHEALRTDSLSLSGNSKYRGTFPDVYGNEVCEIHYYYSHLIH